mgnify:CR=1 FL=1|jgi:hypothetical protein
MSSKREASHVVRSERRERTAAQGLLSRGSRAMDSKLSQAERVEC